MNGATFTFRVDENLKSKFTGAAKAHDRTGAQLLRDFMRSYVKDQQEAAQYDALQDKAQRSRASADAGKLISAAEFEAQFAARRAKTRQQIARSK